MDKFVPDAQLDRWFAFHPPATDRIAEAHQMVRQQCRLLAGVLNDTLPESPEKTLALRAVQDVMMRSNACIALHQRLHGDLEGAPRAGG